MRPGLLYLSLSVVIILLGIYIKGTFGIIFFSLTILVLAGILISVLIDSDIIDSEATIMVGKRKFILGVKLLFCKRKKIYSDKKNIFAIYKKGKVYIFEDLFCRSVFIAKVYCDEYRDDVIKSIRASLESYYNLENIRLKKDVVKNKFYEWDGCLTKEDSRDKKLNSIVKN